MPSTFTEDTIIESRPDQGGLYLDSAHHIESDDASDSVFERCRAVFRQLGERVSSFDLSRQIYG
jgi:hypothetical protein